MTRFDMKCETCGYIEEVLGPFGEKPESICPRCESSMHQYYGHRQTTHLNLGYRESRYANQTDRDIAKFQFEHL